MIRIHYILTILILTSCVQTKTKEKTTETSLTMTTEIAKNLEEVKDDTLQLEIEKNDTKKVNNEKADTLEPNLNIDNSGNSSFNLEEYRRLSLTISFKKATFYYLTDTIVADFNGDGFIDKAVFIKDNETSGIIINHGETEEEVRIGFGEQFSFFTNFDWVNYWGLVEDRITNETTFEENGDILGSKEITLQNSSIALGADEVGGGLITFLNGEYVWIHQTC